MAGRVCALARGGTRVRLIDPIAQLWSTTRFRARGLSTYAERLMVEETRKGVMAMSIVLLLLLFGSVLAANELALKRSYTTTCAALAALSAHVYFSARRVKEIVALHVLGMTLLIVSGTSFVLLAHQHGGFGATQSAHARPSPDTSGPPRLRTQDGPPRWPVGHLGQSGRNKVKRQASRRINGLVPSAIAEPPPVHCQVASS